MLGCPRIARLRPAKAGSRSGCSDPSGRSGSAVKSRWAGRVVPARRLVEELWRGNPPLGAATTLRSYVSRLRAALGPDAVLDGRGGGYMIIVKPHDVDAGRFEQLVAAGQ